MLFVNLFIEKIMKVSKQIWYSLEIFGSKDNREIFIAYIEDYIVGLNEKSDSSILFFDKEFHEKINSKLNNSLIIDNWELLEIEEKNWNKSCEDFFKPIIINDSVRILPNWLDGNDDEFLNIIINPALAFGTGHHETTYMMIQAMLLYEFNGKTVFDIGTGSGILSILAKKRGAKSIYAIDNDILTNNNFHENLELNDVRDINFEIKDCFDILDFNYDFIFANINLNILKQLIPRIESKGTILIISGILDSDEKLLVKVFNDNNRIIKNIYKKNEWLCFVIEL
tara:strand:+ start:295 stop:1143 length:849 start_codon:yes stop_codon:yes gene_type:complete